MQNIVVKCLRQKVFEVWKEMINNFYFIIPVRNPNMATFPVVVAFYPVYDNFKSSNKEHVIIILPTNIKVSVFVSFTDT